MWNVRIFATLSAFTLASPCFTSNKILPAAGEHLPMVVSIAAAVSFAGCIMPYELRRFADNARINM